MANRYRLVNILDAPDAAYIAGLVDGEGTVTLSRIHRNENRRLVVCISNNDFALLQHVKTKIGAGQITSKRVYSPHHAPSFNYQVNSRQALAVLRQIVVYMKSYKIANAVYHATGTRVRSLPISIEKVLGHESSSPRTSSPLDGRISPQRTRDAHHSPGDVP